MLRLTHKIDFCPAGELAGKLDIPEDQISPLGAITFDCEASAREHCEKIPFFEAGRKFVGLVVLEPKMPAAAAKAIERLRATPSSWLSGSRPSLCLTPPRAGTPGWRG